MITFVEFDLANNEKAVVNISRIENFFKSANGVSTKICMNEKDSFSVAHSYDEVKAMLTNIGDVRLYAFKY